MTGLNSFQIFNSLNDPIVVVNMDLEIVFYNESFNKWKGEKYVLKTNLKTDSRDFFPFNDPKLISSFEKLTKESERNGTVIINNMTDLKDDVCYNIEITPFQNHVLTVFKEITAHRDTVKRLIEAEKLYKSTINALRESEDQYRNLITNMGEGIFITDIHGTIIFVNPAIQKMIGFSELELISNPLKDYFYNKSADTLNEQLNSLRKDHTKSEVFELEFRHKNQSKVITRVAASVLINNKKRLIGFYGVLSDITSDRQNELLQERFIATTSHELRTPLTVLIGYLDILRKEVDLSKEKTSEIYQAMLKNAQRLNKLVENVHDVSAIRADMFKIYIEKVNLDEFASEVNDQIRILYPKRTIMIDYTNELQDDPYFSFDHVRIFQVIENLVDNAVKNSSKDSIINLVIRKERESFLISVIDSGAGIKNQEILQLFQPFSHIPTQFSRKGTGLGLYIIKVIVDAHKGKIEVISRVEGGTIFAVQLPYLE